MTWSRSRAIAAALLIGTLAVDAALLYSRQRLWREAAVFPETQIWFPRTAAIPAGFLGNGLSYGPAVTAARFFALLYTSASCGFCAAEMPEWRMLVTRSLDLNCDALRVVPYRGAESPGGTQQSEGRQVVFLDPGWLRGDPPRLTPTLIIFSRGAAAAWCHVGAMDPEVARLAVTALSRAAVAGGRGNPAVVAEPPQDSDVRSEGARLRCR